MGSTPQRADEGVWGPSRRQLTIGLILVIVGAAFEALAVATTMPATSAELGGLALYGWAFSAFMLANLIGITIAGGEADRVGPTPPFLVGVVLFASGLIVSGMATTMPIVILGRAIQGLGAGTISSTAYVAIGRGYPEHARPQMLALLSSAWVVPGLVGPALAGLVADFLGWRWVFLGLAPLPVVAALMAIGGLRQIGPGTTGARDWRRIGASVQLAAGVGLALGNPEVAPLVRAGMIGVGVILVISALQRLMPPGTLRAAHGLPAAIATMMFLNLAFFGADAFVPLTLSAIRGQTATMAGLALTTATVSWTTGAWIQAHSAKDGTRRRVVLIGLALIAIGIGGLLFIVRPDVSVLLAPASWAVAGLGMGLSFSTISLVVLEGAPAGREGEASAAMQIANMLGVSVGTGASGAIIAAGADASGPQPWSFTLVFAVMLMAVGAAAFTASRMARRAELAGATASLA